ncbi:hypothetical protein KKG61_09130 [bacterium]|nr:hypothetical protein [bacterium]MBU1600245.1 hypothetical protein [bacterium]MBU2461540.1 hypothetical protein [bacterium]
MNLRKRRGFLIVNGLCVLIWLFVLAVFQKQILSLRYEIAELEEKANVEDVIRRDLYIEIAQLKNLERIEKVGKNSGFVEAGLHQIAILCEPKFEVEEKMEESEPFGMLAMLFEEKAEAKTVGSRQ